MRSSARSADEIAATNYDRNPLAGGTYTFTMKPNIERDLRDADGRRRRMQTIERRVNELGVAEPSIARTAGSGDQILVQLPGVTDVARAKDIIHRPRSSSSSSSRPARRRRRKTLLQAYGGSVPADMEIVPGVASGWRGDTGSDLLPRAQGRGRHRPGPAQREAGARREQPAGGQLLAEAATAPRKFGKRHGREHRQATWRSSSTTASCRRRGSKGGSPTRDASAAASRAGSATDLSLTLRSGALPASLTYLEERVVGPSLGADSIRAGVHRVARRPRCWSSSSCSSTTSCRASTRSSRWSSTWSSCSG